MLEALGGGESIPWQMDRKQLELLCGMGIKGALNPFVAGSCSEKTFHG